MDKYLDTKKLLKNVAALAVMAVILLGVSLIVHELLIPIGSEWDDAAKGILVVEGTILGFIGLLKLMDRMDAK